MFLRRDPEDRFVTLCFDTAEASPDEEPDEIGTEEEEVRVTSDPDIVEGDVDMIK